MVLKAWQFSIFNANDPNRAKLNDPAASDGVAVWNECRAVAANALDGLLRDPTGGATHYFSYSESQKHLWPKWSKTLPHTKKIGAFRFYIEP